MVFDDSASWAIDVNLIHEIPNESPIKTTNIILPAIN